MEKEALKSPFTDEEEQQLQVQFKKGDADSIRAYRKLRAAYRPKINMMADMYRKQGDNISAAHMMSVAEEMFPQWIHQWEPDKKKFNGYIEDEMNFRFKNEKNQGSIGYSYTPREKAALVSGYKAARAEAKITHVNPTPDDILRFWRIHNPGVTLDDIEQAERYIRTQRMGDLTSGEEEDEGITFDQQRRLQEIKVFDAPTDYVRQVAKEKITLFIEQNFTGREQEALKDYYIKKQPIAFSAFRAGMDNDSFKRLRAKAQQLAKEKRVELQL